VKRVIPASALITAVATGAQTAPVALSSAIKAQILTRAPGASLSSLTNVQYAQTVSLSSNSGDLGAGRNPSGAVKAILNAR